MHSIGRALSLPLLVGVPLLVLIAGTTSSILVASRAYAEFDAALLQKAKGLSALVKMPRTGDTLEFDFSDELMPEFSSATRPEYFELRTIGGLVIERSRSLKRMSLPQPSGRDALPSIRDYVLPDGQPGRVVTIAFSPETADLPVLVGPENETHPGFDRIDNATRHDKHALILTLARSTIDLNRLVAEIIGLFLGVALLLAAAIIILLRVTLRRALVPLAELARQVASIGTKSLNDRVQLNPDVQELNPIVGRINELLDAVEAALVRERDFSANVAHELRTPVSELKCLAEVGLLDAADDGLNREFLRDALGISVQMEQIVDQLLKLASLEAGRTPIDKRLLDLDQIVTELWRTVEVEASDRRIAFSSDIQPGARVLTDRRQLEIILRNLLGNAVQHSPSESEIHVHGTFDTPQRWHLMIRNSAPQLDHTDVVHMFDRFWRKDAARTDSGRTGLGLSLVRAVADALQLHVHAELSPSHLLTISIASR